MRDNEFAARLRSGAADLGATVSPPPPDVIRRMGDRRRRRTMAASGVLAFAIGVGGGGAAYASLDHPGSSTPPPATGQPTPTEGASSAPVSGRPGIVAVTTGGAVVVLDFTTGLATRVLVPGGDAVGDSVAVSPSGSTVYFSVKHGCTDDIEAVPVAGGTPKVIATGVLPALSPDGTELAFVREPVGGMLNPVSYGCATGTPVAGSQFKVVVLHLSTGQQQVYPAAPGAQDQLPIPVSHLSWAPSGRSLLVSAEPPQDNQGWGLSVLELATAQYYLPGNWLASGSPGVAVTGLPDAARSYYEEGVYLADGTLFVDRMCCTGVPVKKTSSLLQEVDASGNLVHQVTMGFLNRNHTSLAGSADGKWLLYLSAHDLFISEGGKTPFKLTSGLIAAGWIP
jgi:hypothetical protein